LLLFCSVWIGNTQLDSSTNSNPPSHPPTKWELVELLAAYMIRPRGLTTSSLVVAKGAGRGNLSWKLIVDQ
jgi:hypothetical protein